MTKLILGGPEELLAEDFSIEPEPTLLDDPLYRFNRKRIADWVDLIPELSARPPREYQLRYAAMGSCRDQNLWAHEQGLGKTYETIMLILARYGDALLGKSHKKLRRGTIQIIAPRHTLKLAWMKELATCGLDGLAQIVTSEKDLERATAPIWLMHYDFLKAQTRHGRALAKKGKVRVRMLKNKSVETYFLGYPMWKKIRKVARPHMVAMDEIHMLREGSDRTEAVEQFVRGVKVRLGLTGTPVDGWIAHLGPILRIIYGSENRVFPWAPKAFVKRFTRERVIDMDYVSGDAGANPVKRAAPGINPDQIPEFWRATRHLMHRLIYRDPEVSADVKYPPVEYALERIPMDPAHHMFYYDLHQSVVQEIEDAVRKIKLGSNNAYRLKKNALTKIQLLRRAASCPWSIEPGFGHDIGKIRRVVEIALAAKAEGRKFVVFTNFIETGRIITQALRAAGVNVVRVYADDKAEKPVHLSQDLREDRIEDFLSDPNIDGLVGNLGLLSTGLTMVQASVVVNFDHDWKANTYKQGISRVVRPGCVWTHVNVHDFVTDRTVDVYLFNALVQKVKATAELIDHQFSLEAPSSEEILVDPLAIMEALVAGDMAIA